MLPEKKLNDAAPTAGVCEFVARGFECDWFAAGYAAWPLVPAAKVAALAERVVEDEIFKPPAILLAEALEAQWSISGSAPRKRFGSFEK